MQIGILGGGQLARMLALAAYPLGFKLSCIDPSPNPCASQLIECVCAPYTDLKSIDALLEKCDLITFENENIPLEIAEYIHQNSLFYPSTDILRYSQDRLFEKQYLQQLGIATAPFVAIENLDSLKQAAASLGYPLVLKTRRFGYDGKGQAIIKSAAEIELHWQQLMALPLIAEAFIDYDQELSLIAVRNQQQILFYSLTLNWHRDGILRLSRAPFVNPTLQQQAQQIATKILIDSDYIGVLTIEFFNKNETLLVNELAPRVHNSGHWTIEGAVTSQFENHLRAITHLPLGDTTAQGFSALYNCIGTLPDIEHILNIRAAHFHSYDKEARPGRKVGHVTLNTLDQKVFDESSRKLDAICLLPH